LGEENLHPVNEWLIRPWVGITLSHKLKVGNDISLHPITLSPLIIYSLGPPAQSL